VDIPEQPTEHSPPLSALKRDEHARGRGRRMLGLTGTSQGLGSRGGSVRRKASRLLTLLLLVILVPMLAGVALLSREAQQPPTAAVSTPTSPPPGTPGPRETGWMSAFGTAAERAYVDSLIAHMSVDEEIGQMVMIEFLGTQMTPDIAYELQQLHAGSVVLYAWNVASADSLRTLDQQLQATAKIPLLISTDQEGGYVNRLEVLDGYLPSAEEMGSRNDPNYVYRRGLADGQQLYDLGVNMNLAPVVDVQNIPDSQTYMHTRMFATTPDKVTTMAGAYLRGLQAGHHVVGTLKHFPGLGSIAADPHQQTVELDRSVADMERIDWAPYRALLATGDVDVIMTTHITVPAIDPSQPTTLSYPVTTGILREKLGFQGVIITDGIYMRAINNASHTFDQIIVGSVLTGNDIICSTYSVDSTTRAVQALQKAVAGGTISKQRLDESVRRILLLKLHDGLLRMTG
jgi:beta-N-acetylhexosaminidase